MKTVLLLTLILYAASAAPAEDKQEAPEAVAVAVVDAPEEEMAAAPGQEEAAPETRFNPCPHGWYHHGTRCFMFVRTPMNWYSAEEYCNGLGGHLASVTNPREYSFLQQITDTAWENAAWLGGFYLQGRWMWIDREGFYYTNWYSQSTCSTYPCTFLRTNYGWGNDRCSYSYCFICSKNPYGC